MEEMIYRALPDPNEHLRPKLSPEEKQAAFIKFVQHPPRYSIGAGTRDYLDLIVDVLAVAREKPGDASQLARACEANWIQTIMVLGFLEKQGLMRSYWATYYPLPGAIDEFLYRLEHDGAASWPEPEPEPEPIVDPHAEARQAAKSKLKSTLRSAGYRGNGSQRLRIVG